MSISFSVPFSVEVTVIPPCPPLTNDLEANVQKEV